MTKDAVLILLTARPLSGAQTCQGIPAERLEITLPEPLGQREVVDARSTDLGELRVVLAELVEG